ncbi:MAG: transposase, partial [Ktedonobacteraceae bacterium]|nr:transposase [Ktedonobacteraceae bacterium]
AKRGAPQAEQEADKFHLLKNLRERLADVATRRHSNLPIIAEARSDAIPARARGRKSPHGSTDTEAAGAESSEKHYRTIPPTPYARPPCGPTPEVQKQERRARRIGLYEDVHLLAKQGVGIRAISRQLKMCRQAVRRYLQAKEFPEIALPPPRGSILDPYKPYIFQRWQQGCRNSVQLYDEIKARGYSGCDSGLRNFLASVRKKHREAGSAEALAFDEASGTLAVKAGLPPQPHVTRRMSPTRASWLMVSREEKLDERQRKSVEHIRQSHPDLEAAYQLAQQFVLMLAEHRVGDVDAWLVQAEESGLPELRKMAKGIRQDESAVRATFTSEWSNGQVEAQVNCLKLQKRIVFGRADFDLLRLRVLCRV